MLQAALVRPGDPDYQALLSWPFPQDPFYVAQVIGLLRGDVPQRFAHGGCSVWLYRDTNSEVVGFGTLDLSDDHHHFTNEEQHAYIPVLGVHPHHGGKGYGKWVVEHLFAEALMLRALHPALSDLLLLDVYQANTPAIRLYEKSGFQTLNSANPIPDPSQNNEPYLVMARKLA